MSDHHDNHSNEQKPVSFTVPFILGAVTLIIILLLVSLGDPCKDECVCDKNCSKECMEACEKGDHSKHPEEMKEGHAKADEAAEDKSLPVVDTADAKKAAESTKPEAEPAKAEHH
jgi:hypothetical protein